MQMRENRKSHISVSYCGRQISFYLTVKCPTCMYSSSIQEIKRYQAHVIGRPNKLFEQGIIEWNLVVVEIHFVSSQTHSKISDPNLSFPLAKEQDLNRIILVSSYYHSNHTILLFLKKIVLLKYKGVWMMRMSFSEIASVCGWRKQKWFSCFCCYEILISYFVK